jgi:hypothetical protein
MVLFIAVRTSNPAIGKMIEKPKARSRNLWDDCNRTDDKATMFKYVY